MSVPDEHHDPSGTVYGARPAPRPGLPRDPLMRFALATGLVGVLLGVFFATGVLGGGDEPPVVPAAAASAPPTQEPTPEIPEVTASSPATPSPSASPTTPPAPAAVTGPKVLRSVVSGLCVGTDGDDEKAEAELAACTGGPEQQWVANPVTPDLVTLTNAAHGQCLDVEGGSGDDGAKLQQYPCHGQANQQWRLTPMGSGPVLLVAVHSGKCAEAKDGGTEAGDELRQVPCTGSAQQQWTVG
ncbi:RICIN domain-containing protein [Micromonospora halophytica]|uniref:Ricin-type beta-trefoil lectin domain-containing protein n=1 Tax=Micromonospora halophytica TaxID=47864 RepID=A0A1C5HB00_9ACTN|nr:RICIN domain-containing protein [Micromonospora halophytica]SCG43195.1 Ricin-type beta-trefoil lectin domain-containing protein [Micromonospora halophytica]